MYIGKPQPPDELVDRKREVEEMVKNLSNPRLNYCYAVIGYRRIGKSSILLKVQAELSKKGIIAVYFDVKENMSDPEFFLDQFSKAVLAECRTYLTLRESIKSKAKDLGNAVRQQIVKAVASVKGMGAEFTINADGTWSVMPKIEFGDQRGRDYAGPFKAVFGMPNELASKLGRRMVIILDEFQDMTALAQFRGLKNVLDQFRGVLQTRKNVCYVISESRVHMLEALLRDRTSPFYMHFKEMQVRELDENSAEVLFLKILRSRGIPTRHPSVAAKEAVKLVGGNPFYIMILAEEWDARTGLRDAFEHVIQAPTGPIYLYVNYLLAEDLSKARGGPTLRQIVVALAREPLTFSQIARAIKKNVTSIGFYLEQLQLYDVITKDEEGRYSLVDKVVAECVKSSS